MTIPFSGRALVALTAVGLVVAAATGLDDHAIGARAPEEVAVTAPPAVETTVRRGQVTGAVTGHRRTKAVHQVATVVDGWLEAGFVAGLYPRSSFGQAYRGFSSAARPAARRDGDLLTNRRLGPRIDGVEVRAREVTVDLLGTRGHARAATAHVLLRLRTHGPDRRLTVRGRLFLLPGPHGWRIFGYDLSRGAK